MRESTKKALEMAVTRNKALVVREEYSRDRANRYQTEMSRLKESSEVAVKVAEAMTGYVLQKYFNATKRKSIKIDMQDVMTDRTQLFDKAVNGHLLTLTLKAVSADAQADNLGPTPVAE